MVFIMCVSKYLPRHTLTISSFVIIATYYVISVLPTSAFSFQSVDESIMQDISIQADEGTSSCQSVDLVIAIDQSSSMMPTEDTNSPSDPNDFRSEAAKLLVTELLVNQLLECPHINHRWSVIEFGGSVRSLQDMVPFSIDTMSPNLNTDEAAAFVTGLQESIPTITEDDNPDQTDRSLRFTDFRLAFKNAVEDQFATTRSTNDEQEPIRSLVIITDGAPCTQEGGYVCLEENAYQMTSSALTAYMDELYGIWLDNFENEIDLYLIPINARANYLDKRTVGSIHATSDSSDSKFDTIYAYWEKMTAGNIFRVESTGRTVTKAVTDISRQMLGRGEALDLQCTGEQNNEFFMPPYQDQAEIIVLKEEFDDQFSLNFTLPNNQAVTVTNGEANDSEEINETITYLTLNRSEIYRFIPPVPGRWTFDVTNCDRMFVRFSPVYLVPEAVEPRGAMNTFPDAPYYDIDNPIRYQVDINNGENPDLILQSLATTPLNVTVSIWHEDEARSEAEDIQLIRVDETSTVFQSAEGDYVKTPKFGLYHMSVSGSFTAEDIQDTSQFTTYQLFDDVEYTFIAKDLTEFEVNIVSPEPNDLWRFNKIEGDKNSRQSLDIEVALVAPDGRDFPYDTANIEADFETYLYLADGSVETVELKSTGENGRFTASIQPPNLDELQVGIDYSYTLQVSFAGNYDDRTYYLGEKSESLSFIGFVTTGIRPVLAPIESDEIYTSFVASCEMIPDGPFKAFFADPPTDINIPADIQFEIRYGDEYKLAAAEDLTHVVSGEITDYLQGRLIKDDGTVILDDLSFVQQNNQFVLSQPIQGIRAPSVYHLEIQFLPDDTLDNRFTQTELTAKTTFERANSGYASSTLCNITLYITGLALLGLILFFGWQITGPSRGSIKLELQTGTTAVVRLTRYGFIRRWREREFALNFTDHGITKMVVARSGTGADTEFEVEILDFEGNLIGREILSNSSSDSKKPFGLGTLEYKL